MKQYVQPLVFSEFIQIQNLNAQYAAPIIGDLSCAVIGSAGSGMDVFELGGGNCPMSPGATWPARCTAVVTGDVLGGSFDMFVDGGTSGWGTGPYGGSIPQAYMSAMQGNNLVIEFCEGGPVSTPPTGAADVSLEVNDSEGQGSNIVNTTMVYDPV